MKTAAVAGGTGIAASCAQSPSIAERTKLFSFVFFTDVHVQPEIGATEGLLAAIEKMNSLNPDFAISGGDLVFDALNVDEERANLLYDIYIDAKKNFAMPVYDCMGNHEVFGIYAPDKVSENHPDWGKNLFKRRLGDGRTYRSFDHKGVKFLLLDTIGIEKNEDKAGHHYIGEIGSEQMSWIKSELNGLGENGPVILAGHIPLFTWWPQIAGGPQAQTAPGTALTDGKELFDMLMKQNLFCFLEGHIHINEHFEYLGRKFLDCGAVCGGWWAGPRFEHPEGFTHVTVYEDGIEYEYVTYGWDASKYKQAALDREVFRLV